MDQASRPRFKAHPCCQAVIGKPRGQSGKTLTRDVEVLDQRAVNQPRGRVLICFRKRFVLQIHRSYHDISSQGLTQANTLPALQSTFKLHTIPAIQTPLLSPV